jgi:hypothetical protein
MRERSGKACVRQFQYPPFEVFDDGKSWVAGFEVIGESGYEGRERTEVRPPVLVYNRDM